nr:protein FAR1-related sequence 5-like [Tanacetum cinerariifolium]
MVVIGEDIVTDIVTLPETNVIKENEIDMNVMLDDLNETTAADVVDVYDIDPEFVSTPNEHKYWVPNVHVDEKPKINIVLTHLMHKAHRLRVALLGGFEKVCGMPIDWNNFKRDMNKLIGERDAQMLVDKMVKRQHHVPKFSFYHHTIQNKLVRMFWADETMKCNYDALGDIVSFDATYDTNTYGMVFVPFTGIDYRQKCVLFGAALLSDETTESYAWMLTLFLKAHKKQPIIAVTDQDSALRKTILQVFTQSHHRLYMWHITQKLPTKRGALCGLMKMTSRSESSNAFFQVYSHHGNSLVHFILCFESAMEKQRFLCRHVFYVFGTLGMDNIPENYISRRWRKNPLPNNLRDKRHRYGPCIEESESLASDIYSRVEDCINLIRNDPDKLKVFLAKVTNMKKELENDMSCGNKGHRRFKSAAEKGKAIKKARMNQKIRFKHRECSKCGQMFHNKHTCDEKRFPDEEYQALVKKKKDAGEVDVNESDEDEEDVEVDDVDEDDGTDEHDEDEDKD